MRLIDADKVLEKNFYTLKQYSKKEADAWRDGVALVEKEIENAPNVDLKLGQFVAHWINEEDYFGNTSLWTCSNCKETFILEEGTPEENEYNFCPHCGANMGGDAQ